MVGSGSLRGIAKNLYGLVEDQESDLWFWDRLSGELRDIFFIDTQSVRGSGLFRLVADHPDAVLSALFGPLGDPSVFDEDSSEDGSAGLAEDAAAAGAAALQDPAGGDAAAVADETADLGDLPHSVLLDLAMARKQVAPELFDVGGVRSGELFPAAFELAQNKVAAAFSDEASTQDAGTELVFFPASDPALPLAPAVDPFG